jgi:hypothetical protein
MFHENKYIVLNHLKCPFTPLSVNKNLRVHMIHSSIYMPFIEFSTSILEKLCPIMHVHENNKHVVAVESLDSTYLKKVSNSTWSVELVDWNRKNQLSKGENDLFGKIPTMLFMLRFKKKTLIRLVWKLGQMKESGSTWLQLKARKNKKRDKRCCSITKTILLRVWFKNWSR